MLHIDLAVDRNDFAVLKRSFNRPGQRKFVYIGHAGWTKNTSYLSRIAALMPESAISWIGSGYPSIRGLTRLGFQDFATDQGRLSVAAHDFMITVGKADANPTTILEAMAWGLIPVCTPQSGYVDQPGIVNIPIDDAAQAVTILRQLQAAPESKLQEMQANNWQALNNHYNWNRFAEQVMAAIESDISPEVGHVSATNRLYLRWLALTSPHSAWRPSNFLRFFARNLWRQRHTQFSQSG